MTLSALIRLAWASALNRRATVIWLVLSIALTTLSVLGIERIREKARDNFSQAVAGTDLIVGPRSSPIQLTLYSVFRLGEATANLSWASAEHLRQHPGVAWTIPIALGDSHRGFAVLGTDNNYPLHFRFGQNQLLEFAQGAWANGLFEAVIGSQVASKLKYELGQSIVLSHGSGESLGQEHSDKPFKVVGILKPTGTPVDRTVHISLASYEAIHLGWQAGVPAGIIPPEFVTKFDLTPKSITALLVGLKSRAGVFEAQSYINSYKNEALMAVMPGIAMDQLWTLLGVAEKALFGMALLVGIVSLFGLVAVLLTGLQQRRRELAVLRSVGATPMNVLQLLFLEGAMMTLAGCLLGVMALMGLSGISGVLGAAELGLNLQHSGLMSGEWLWLALIFVTGCLASLIPAVTAFTRSLSDGLLIKS